MWHVDSLVVKREVFYLKLWANMVFGQWLSTCGGKNAADDSRLLQ